MKTVRWAPLVWMFLAAPALFSCGSEEHMVAGKPAGSETSDELSARVLNAEGKPVVGASVRLRPVDFVAGSVLAKDFVDLTTDSSGTVAFPLAPKGRWMMEVRGEGQGLSTPFAFPTDGGRKLLPLVLRPFGGIRGKVDLPLGCRFARVRLVGMDRVDTTDSTGSFLLRDLSPSDSSLTLRVSREDDETMIAETLVQIKSAETIDLGKARTPSFVLADFENGLRLGLPWPDARWYIDNRAPLRERSFDTNAVGHPGKALRMPFLEGTTGVVFMNVNFRGARDLLSLDSVEIWVKGKGGISLYLYSAASAWPLMLDSLAVRDTSTWQRFVVKPLTSFAWHEMLQAEFQQATGVSLKLESAGKDLYVDEVRFFGVSTRDWHW